MTKTKWCGVGQLLLGAAAAFLTSTAFHIDPGFLAAVIALQNAVVGTLMFKGVIVAAPTTPSKP